MENLLAQQHRRLFKVAQLIESKIITLDDLATLIPGIFQVNNSATLALDYMSKNGLDLMRYDLEEVRILGPELLTKHQSRYTLEVTYPKLIEELGKKDPNHIISFYQDWFHTPGERPDFYYSTSKILNDNQHISITVDPRKINQLNSNINDIFGINKIFESFFHHYQNLTKREKEILSSLAKDLSRREISDEFFISEKTVKKHCENIYRKLGTSKRSEIVNIGLAFSTII